MFDSFAAFSLLPSSRLQSFPSLSSSSSPLLATFQNGSNETLFRTICPSTSLFSLSTLLTYPESDSNGDQIIATVQDFCLPKGMALLLTSVQQPDTTFHSFIMTDGNGKKVYGSVITIFSERRISKSDIADIYNEQIEHEKKVLFDLNYHWDYNCSDRTYKSLKAALDAKKALIDRLGQIRDRVEWVYCPTCLVLLSPYLLAEYAKQRLFGLLPFLHVAEGNVSVKDKRFLDAALSELFMEDYNPRLSQLSLSPILSLPSNIIVYIFEAILSERQILFLSAPSDSFEMLTQIVHCFASLIFPLKWHYPIIPILPNTMSGVLSVPQPFIIGLPSDTWIGRELMESAVIVNIDDSNNDSSKNTTNMPVLTDNSKQLQISLPSSLKNEMITRLDKFRFVAHPLSSTRNIGEVILLSSSKSLLARSLESINRGKVELSRLKRIQSNQAIQRVFLYPILSLLKNMDKVLLAVSENRPQGKNQESIISNESTDNATSLLPIDAKKLMEMTGRSKKKAWKNKMAKTFAIEQFLTEWQVNPTSAEAQFIKALFAWKAVSKTELDKFLLVTLAHS